MEKDEINLSSGPDNSSGPFYWFNVNPEDPGASVQVNRLAKGFKPSTTDEIILGIERQIAPELSGSLAYTYRTIHNLAFSPLIGTTRESYQYFGNATGTVTADPSFGGITLGFDVPYYGLIDVPRSLCRYGAPEPARRARDLQRCRGPAHQVVLTRMDGAGELRVQRLAAAHRLRRDRQPEQ